MPDFAAQLGRMTAADQEPTLSSADIEDLLTMFKKTDSAGYLPADPLWTPTYNLRAAAREGWKWKAARAAELQSTDLDGDRMSANQIFEHCQRMIKVYSNTASPSTGPPPTIV